MKGHIEDFGTGWFGVEIGLKEEEIDQLVAALQSLKKEKTHFHLRSEFEGSGGVGDIQFYYQPIEAPSDLELESSCKEVRS